MLRFIVFILFLFLPCTLFLGGKSSDSTPDSAERAAASDVEAYASLYRSMQLEGVVNWKAFRQAVAGYYKIDNRKREVLTLIDFSRPIIDAIKGGSVMYIYAETPEYLAHSSVLKGADGL